MIVTIITVIISLSFLVFVHELGHFLAAKKVGVHVLEFSIGFPPKLVSKVIGKTEYLISLIPIGGYVRLKGQGIDDEDESDPENYAAKTVFQRFQILIAGPLMNLLITLILLPLVFFIGYDIPAYLQNAPVISKVDQQSRAELIDIRKGDRILAVNNTAVTSWREVHSALLASQSDFISLKLERDGAVLSRQFSAEQLRSQESIGWHAVTPPIIGAISPGSPAADSGLSSGDQITHINGIQLDDWSQISLLIQKSEGQAVTLSITREGLVYEVQITPRWEERQNSWILGIGSQTVRVSEGFIDSIIMGSKRAYFLTVKTFEFLFRLLSGQEKSDSVGGPIMIAKMMGEAAQTGVSSLLTLVAFISLQFAIFNLLPIPALDGGHIVFLIFEAITGKTLSKNARASIQRIGFSLLLLLILYISVQDGIRLFNG